MLTEALCFWTDHLAVHPSRRRPADKQTVLHTGRDHLLLVCLILLRCEQGPAIIITNNPVIVNVRFKF